MLKFSRFFYAHKASIALCVFSCMYFTILFPADNTFNTAQAEEDLSKTTYGSIAQLYIPSLTKLAMKEERLAKDIQKQNAELIKDKKLKEVKLPVLGEVEKLKLAYNFLAHNEKLSNESVQEEAQEPVQRVLNNNVFQDLEIFCGGKTDLEHHLFRKLDRTVTTLGKIELQKMLYAPTNDTKTLYARQAIVLSLLDDSLLFNAVEEKLKKIRESEQEFIWFWKTLDEATTMFFDQVYFKQRKLFGMPFFDFSGYNKSQNLLELSALWETTGKPAFSVLWPTIIFAFMLPFFKFFCLKSVSDRGINIESYNLFLNRLIDALKDNSSVDSFLDSDIGRELRYNVPGLSGILYELRSSGNLTDETRTYIIKWLKFVAGVFSESYPWFATKWSVIWSYEYIKYFPTVLKNIASQHIPWWAKAIWFLWISALIYGYCKGITSAVGNAKNYNNISNIIQEKMINVATYVNSVRELGAIVQKSQIGSLMPECATIAVNPAVNNSDTETLVKNLETGTFKGHASCFSHKGRALAMFKIMGSEKDSLVDSLSFAGRLDAYLSIAKLYKEHANNPRAQYCFAEYTSGVTPYVNLVNFWHPELNPNTVVTNSIELGGQSTGRDVILTGPNAAGKSTALKAMTIVLIMGLSLGIAPARKVVLTPFSSINTYLNIADTEGKESLFQAEMNRAHALLESLRKLGPRGFSFIIMDEIFTGTNPEEGQAGAYAVAKNIATFSNAMCVVATHFKKLTELETATSGSYKNYKVYVIKNPDGSFVYPYKLEQGISDQAIALQLLEQSGFASQIINDAYNVMQKEKQKVS